MRYCFQILVNYLIYHLVSAKAMTTKAKPKKPRPWLNKAKDLTPEVKAKVKAKD